MPAITSQRTTGNVLSSQRTIDLANPILLLEPDAAPITVILKQVQNMGRRIAAKDPKFSWHVDQLETRFDAVNNGVGYADNATSIVVDNGTLFAAEDLVRVPRTGEVMSVTSISTNTLTVVRAFGSSTAAALVDNDPLYIIGTAAEEGDTAQPPRSENPTKYDNYTQIFKHTVAASATWLSSSNESSPHDWPHQVRKQMIEHLKDIEGSFLFGSPGTTTGADGGPRRVNGGFLHYYTANNQAAGGTLDEAEWETFIRTITRYGSKKKVVFVSRLVASVLNNYAVGKMQTVTNQSTYGVNVTEFLSPHGSVKIVVHDMLEGATWGGYALAVDFAQGNVAYRYLDGDGPGPARDTKVYPDRAENDRDGDKEEIISEVGLQPGEPRTGGLLTGVTG